MRVAITVDPEVPVPPRQYGGIERIVDMLVRGLAERGHQVTLFAHPDSQVPCRLEPYPGRSSRSRSDLLRNMWHVSAGIVRGRYDVVHSFGRLAYLLPVLPLSVPKIMSYQRAVTPGSVEWGERLSHGTLHFAACARHMSQRWHGRPNWHVVYNAAPVATYRFSPSVPDGAPLMFLGRMEEIKGPHLAIEVARRSDHRLILAGNVPDGRRERAFFEREIRPHLDGETIRYAGPVDDTQKNELLGRAKALLMPILWEEPFGIVMAEALACGTPIIGLRRGSVPEVVEDGVNGFVVDSVEGMACAVQRLEEIDRAACRRTMEERFSDRALVGAFEGLYMRLAARDSRI